MSRLNYDLRNVSRPMDMEVYDGKPVEYTPMFSPVSAEGLVVTDATYDEWGEARLIQLQKGR